MATINIPIEIPADSAWNVSEFIAEMKEYARELLARPASYEMPAELFEELMLNSERQIKEGKVYSQEEIERMVASW